MKQVYAFAVLHGEKVDNPAECVGAASIATFVPKDRALSPQEIRLMETKRCAVMLGSGMPSVKRTRTGFSRN